MRWIIFKFLAKRFFLAKEQRVRCLELVNISFQFLLHSSAMFGNDVGACSGGTMEGEQYLSYIERTCMTSHLLGEDVAAEWFFLHLHFSNFYIPYIFLFFIFGNFFIQLFPSFNHICMIFSFYISLIKFKRYFPTVSPALISPLPSSSLRIIESVFNQMSISTPISSRESQG